MKTIERATKIMDFIQSFDNRRKIMYTCAGMYHKEDFKESLDLLRDVIGMKSGIYDFVEDKLGEWNQVITLSYQLELLFN